jgi:hypothetical protein
MGRVIASAVYSKGKKVADIPGRRLPLGLPA